MMLNPAVVPEANRGRQPAERADGYDELRRDPEHRPHLLPAGWQHRGRGPRSKNLSSSASNMSSRAFNNWTNKPMPLDPK